MRLILASRSPRRRELLLAAGIDHVVRAADVDEAVQPDESPVEYVRRVARDKALAIPRSVGEIVLGADTTVVCDGQILGKPFDAADAARMLHLLRGKVHDVITGICLIRGDRIVRDHAVTRVWFNDMTTEEIKEYVRTGEPMDKAGAYAIQGVASRYIESIEGSYSNVVGLPVALVWRVIESIRSPV